ncbi:hypothetical protein ABTJ88_19490, partial [Acinetobacter baumannii]
CKHDAPVAGPGAAQLLHAPRADFGREAGGVAGRHPQAGPLGAASAAGRGANRVMAGYAQST